LTARKGKLGGGQQSNGNIRTSAKSVVIEFLLHRSYHIRGAVKQSAERPYCSISQRKCWVAVGLLETMGARLSPGPFILWLFCVYFSFLSYAAAGFSPPHQRRA